jgi:hypothetical protein
MYGTLSLAALVIAIALLFRAAQARIHNDFEFARFLAAVVMCDLTVIVATGISKLLS